MLALAIAWDRIKWWTYMCYMNEWVHTAWNYNKLYSTTERIPYEMHIQRLDACKAIHMQHSTLTTHGRFVLYTDVRTNTIDNNASPAPPAQYIT
jgi:hypothetical protein